MPSRGRTERGYDESTRDRMHAMRGRKCVQVTGRSVKQTLDAVEGITVQGLNDHYATISRDREIPSLIEEADRV